MNATDLYFLNDVQYAFLIGRQSNAELCQVSCHVLIQYHAKSIDVERFRAAWQALAARHIVLQTRIFSDGAVSFAEHHTADSFFLYQDFTGESDPEACGKAYLAQLESRLMDLEHGELAVLHLLHVDASHDQLILEADCAAFDITSAQIFLQDVARLYAGVDLP